MKIKSVVFAILFSTSSFLPAQNIVENGSFEVISGKPKNPGEIFLAPPWVGGTKAIPDLYSPSAKNSLIKVPENAYGEQEPKDGKNYAGILIYSNREAEPRSFLSAKLKYPMLAGEHYCVRYYISFADLSKYASNNISCYISHDSIGSESDLILNHQPQVEHSTNRIFEKQWDWEAICRIYVADGGEKFITFGNFKPQTETRVISVKRPPGVTVSQIRDGYYFIDHISITPNATQENCKCEPGTFAFANLDKEEASFETDKEDIPDKVIIGTTGSISGEAAVAKVVHEDVTVEFGLGKSNLDSKNTIALEEVSKFLKENDKAKITLISHNDKSEAAVKGISKKRLDQVAKYLMSKGVDQGRIESKDVQATAPIDDSGTKENRHLNMVVEIKFSE